jgi:hypothetical protein
VANEVLERVTTRKPEAALLVTETPNNQLRNKISKSSRSDYTVVPGTVFNGIPTLKSDPKWELNLSQYY